MCNSMLTPLRERGFTQKKLRDITGAFRPGVLTALMGVSGVVKTTLMDVLAGRKTSGTIEGDIRIGGFPKEFVKEVLEIIEFDEIKDFGMPGVSGLSTEQRKCLTWSLLLTPLLLSWMSLQLDWMQEQLQLLCEL
ncbi:hypothetical protein CsSME_00010506 [Camellia sinensis var. sinensis]